MELPMLDVDAVGTRETVERREPSPPTLIPGWRCVSPAIVRAGGEEGFIDLVALHPGRGVALIALLDAGEEASPEEAHAAFRTMLEEAGFRLRFSGELPVVALAERRADADRLAATVERRFAALPRPELAPDWVEWVTERLLPPSAAPAPVPRLTAAREEPLPAAAAPTLLPPLTAAREDPSSAPAAEAPVLQLIADRAEPAPAPAELLAVAQTPPAAESPAVNLPPAPPRGWIDYGGSLGFSVGIVLVLLLGLALLTHAGRLF